MIRKREGEGWQAVQDKKARESERIISKTAKEREGPERLEDDSIIRDSEIGGPARIHARRHDLALKPVDIDVEHLQNEAMPL